jgi:hypothetical protein
MEILPSWELSKGAQFCGKHGRSSTFTKSHLAVDSLPEKLVTLAIRAMIIIDSNDM